MLFYSGLDLISTYRDTRLVKTMRESIQAIKDGDNIVAFPEISDKGYLAELEGFHEGTVLLAEFCYKRGIDIPIFVTYFRKSDLKYIIDKPVLYSELASDGKTRAEIAAELCRRCNALGKMQFNADEKASLSQKIS